MFGISSETMTCPHCHAVITTNLEKEIPSSVHVAACLLCVVFFPLAWLPYYMNVSGCQLIYISFGAIESSLLT